MEFVACLPPTFKLSGTRKKRILKAALRGLLPDTILDRPKMGFSIPLADWFRGELREMVHDVLLSPQSLQRGYFQQSAVANMVEQHSTGVGDYAENLWDLLILELWHRTFIDGKACRDGKRSPI
jgi:asparagine synthase (glutamine-hydrolysing)